MHRPLKPNIPYNKNFAFQKAAAQLSAAAFFASALPNRVAFTAAVFRHTPSREKTGLENPQIFQTCK
jgi:hypothetical protein